MPDDDSLEKNPQLMKDFEEVRRYFLDYPDPRCVKLFLNAFGGWNGFGMYQTVEQVFYKMNEQFVIDELQKNLRNVSRLKDCTLYWNIQQCIVFPDRALFDPLTQFIKHPLPEIRHALVYALSQIEGDDVTKHLKEWLAIEDDDGVTEALEEVINEL
ncbi:hypothetical protein GCM10022407_26890 [Hymenobacter antarcticus]|uniref:HEAT repeat-containing protein n=2 Tax=Hymenobacter antarcticus TaxID=486270 RepID=A0ABP7QCH9_9BACT